MTGHVRTPRRPGGYLLVEMLMALTLLVMFALIVTQLEGVAGKLIKQTEREEPALASFDGAVRQLRADAWASPALSVTGDTLRMEQPDGRAESWAFDQAGRSLTRTAKPSG